jgi:multiple antibiotic resistance protein
VVVGTPSRRGAGPVDAVMTELLTHAFVTLLVVIDPIGLGPMFAAMTAGQEAVERRRTALLGVAVAAGVLVLFAVAGQWLLSALGVSLAAFRIAGGVLLFLVAIDMLFAKHSGISWTTPQEAREASVRRDVAVFPLAIPLIAGPGAIASTLLLMTRAEGSMEMQVMVVAVLLGVLLLVLIALLAAARLLKLLGVTGTNVVTRVLGMLLAALAVQFIIDGLRQAFALG